MSQDEKWREREKARRPPPKARGKRVKAEAKPVPVPVPPMPEPPKFTRLKVELTNICFDQHICFDQQVLEPRQKSRLEQVVEILESMKLTITDLGTRTYVNMDGSRADFRVNAFVKPCPIERESPFLFVPILDQRGLINLHGGGASVDKPVEAVRLARRYMMELCAHEIDEWLCKAGLGPDPHTWSDGLVPNEEVGRLSPKLFP